MPEKNLKLQFLPYNSPFFYLAFDNELKANKANGGAKVQVTGRRSGYRSQVRPPATGQVTGHITGHTKTIGHWTKLFLIDILL